MHNNDFENLWVSLEPLFNAMATFFTSHTGIFFYCSGLLIWASIAAIVLHSRITPVQNQIRKANEALRKDAPDEVGEKTEMVFKHLILSQRNEMACNYF